jgi:hypothetical protein
MKNKGLIGGIFVMAMFATQCGSVGKIETNAAMIDSVFTTNKSIIVGFKDNRVMVIDGSQSINFLGYLISFAGIHWPLNTKTARPLTDLFTDSVVSAMRNLSLKATPVYLRDRVKKDSAIAIMKQTAGDRLAFVDVNEWTGYEKGRDVMVYEVHYNLKLNILDQDGNLLASPSTSGIAEVRGGAVGNQEHLYALSNETFRQQMRKLFFNDTVKAALK